LLAADPTAASARAALATPVHAVGDWLADRGGGARSATLREWAAPLSAPRAARRGPAAAAAAAALGTGLLDDFGGDDSVGVSAVLLTLGGGVAFHAGAPPPASLPTLASLLAAGAGAGAEARSAGAAVAAAGRAWLGGGKGGKGWSPRGAVGLCRAAWAPLAPGSGLLGVSPYPGAPPSPLALHAGGQAVAAVAARRGRAAALLLVPPATPPASLAALAAAMDAGLARLDAVGGGEGDGHEPGTRYRATAGGLSLATPPPQSSAVSAVDAALLAAAADAAVAVGGEALLRAGGDAGTWAAAARSAGGAPSRALLLRPGACDDTPAAAAAAAAAFARALPGPWREGGERG
jgi:hypothetical protein